MNLLSKLKTRKQDNKGNTLSIVIIGIFLLAILGTLILNVTATNLKIRVAEYKSEKQFYYAEKAIDQIYAGIGGEVMTTVRDSYNDVLTNYVQTSGTNTFKTLSNTAANEMFKTQYMTTLKNNTSGYPKGNVGINNIKNRFQTYINDITDCSCKLDMSASNVLYDSDTDTNTITINNVKIVTIKDGYSASVTTDFIIKKPDIDIKFVDSSSKDFTYFFSNALIIDGNDNVTQPALKIEPGVRLTLNGNSYFGSNNSGPNKAYAKNSIEAEGNSIVKINADSNIVCKGSMVLNGAKVDVNAKRLWARNIVTNDYYTAAIYNSVLNINGDCIIADDMEVNGTNSTIKIQNGSYYGFGYEGSSSDVTSNDYRKEAASSDIVRYMQDEGVTSYSSYTFEHEKRSAIMINGTGADVDLSGLNQLILGGRAYIDLDNTGSEAYATYMTGESVALKGNQQAYIAKLNKLGSISSNPCLYEQVASYISGGTLNYSALGMGTDVLAKKIGTNVYFYNKVTDPVIQTANYLASYNDEQNSDVKSSVNNNVKSLDVKEVLLPNNRFTVGNASEVTSGYNYSLLGSGQNGTLTNDPYSLIPDMKLRTDFMVNELKDFSDTYELGTQLISQSQSAVNTTPYENFINTTTLATKYGTNWEKQNFQDPSSGMLTVDEANELKVLLASKGLTGDNARTGVYFYDNASRSEEKPVANGVHAGVIICTGDCYISNDFTGLIICGGNLRVIGNCTITADKDIAQYIADHYEPLQELLAGYVPGSGAGTNVDIKNITYKDLVSQDNWKKNVN